MILIIHQVKLYKNGIILSSKSDKGKVLLAFLKRILWKPKKIIFVDNYLYNIHSVKEEIKKTDIVFIGIHFTFVNDESDKYPLDRIESKANCLVNNAFQLQKCSLYD